MAWMKLYMKSWRNKYVSKMMKKVNTNDEQKIYVYCCASPNGHTVKHTIENKASNSHILKKCTL